MISLNQGCLMAVSGIIVQNVVEMGDGYALTHMKHIGARRDIYQDYSQHDRGRSRVSHHNKRYESNGYHLSHSASSYGYFRDRHKYSHNGWSDQSHSRFLSQMKIKNTMLAWCIATRFPFIQICHSWIQCIYLYLTQLTCYGTSKAFMHMRVPLFMYISVVIRHPVGQSSCLSYEISSSFLVPY